MLPGGDLAAVMSQRARLAVLCKGSQGSEIRGPQKPKCIDLYSLSFEQHVLCIALVDGCLGVFGFLYLDECGYEHV